MKSVIKKTMLALAMIAFGLHLNAKTELSISSNDDNTVTITLEKMSTETSLVLKDYNGTVMYRGAFDKKTRNLNLKELPDGTYFILVEDAYKLERSMVVKKAGKLKTMTSGREIVFKPTFMATGKTLRMSMTNPKKVDVAFHVYDSKGYEVASTTGNDLVIKKTFDFGNGGSESYSIKTKIGDNSFSKTISLN